MKALAEDGSWRRWTAGKSSTYQYSLQREHLQPIFKYLAKTSFIFLCCLSLSKWCYLICIYFDFCSFHVRSLQEVLKWFREVAFKQNRNQKCSQRQTATLIFKNDNVLQPFSCIFFFIDKFQDSVCHSICPRKPMSEFKLKIKRTDCCCCHDHTQLPSLLEDKKAAVVGFSPFQYALKVGLLSKLVATHLPHTTKCRNINLQIQEVNYCKCPRGN